VILRPDVPPSQAPQLTFLSAVAVVEAIEALTPLKPSIKWPNDVLVGRYKVAGLLNEMSAETDRVSFVILGIGVNLNMRSDQFPEDLRSPASSLALLGGSPIDREQFAARVLSALDRQYQRFLREGFDPIRQEWSRLCTAAGKTVRVLSGDRLIEGGFAGVDHDGALLVATFPSLLSAYRHITAYNPFDTGNRGNQQCPVVVDTGKSSFNQPIPTQHPDRLTGSRT
jgi:BirA family biotin operon repressor/biotin-[acetyl-CoA-carboxylase] ligase